jgi:hypothetical protein
MAWKETINYSCDMAEEHESLLAWLENMNLSHGMAEE